MKVRKKQNGTKISDMLSDFDDRAKGCFLKSEEFGDLSDHILSGRDALIKEENFSTVDQLDIMDISVSNFQFATFNKMELEGLDIINENDFIEKDELFHTDLVSNGSRDLEEVNSFEGVTLSLPKDIEDSSNNTPKEVTENLDDAAQKLSKRAQKRKKQLEESKPQCPVRTTARHFTKMFDFFEANPGLATGQLPKINYRKKWRDLTEILNQQGIGEKTTEKWQKTWSDYKLHLRKKLSGIKRSGKALDVPNQFTEQDKRALINMGVSLCDELSIKKRFNPDSIESEDSSSHSATTLQAVNIPTQPVQNGNIPTVTHEVNFSTAGPKKRPKFNKQQRQRKLAERRRKVQRLRQFRAKTAEYQMKSLAELRSLRSVLDKGLNRIGDVLERLVRNSESNASVATNLAETAAQIATTATSFAKIITGFDNKHSNTQL
ncbi:uncharacterized protein LOC108904223 [Anoplophora glabripennis]|uniref:uncharacterized protein LOC108904223 n=1 Tax=Anoplophora glabripennis TaxID=217634 RepID=UPI0008748008|nr:uncharacterized protein LOC108904223 [Anoplophora glabripennis]